ncbi:unnamed protein product [Hyaloperonospora brassicae]|uniref:FYVE-type domain-containing protein n=1 Tax=Hyaloperonospora brassicae TaxID=162125 RepID=A0AAV0TJW8_HYABA|nr:unnamed protein product [Hyaloperonospora brassicae]
MALTPIASEHQARVCGRARANEIFRPVRWRRIAAASSDDAAAKLYEHAHAPKSDPRTGRCSYSVRAVDVLCASMAEVEAVLTGGAVARRRRSKAVADEPELPHVLTRLLPHTFVAHGAVVQYPSFEHASSERETVGLRFARRRPFRVQKEEKKEKERHEISGGKDDDEEEDERDLLKKKKKKNKKKQLGIMLKKKKKTKEKEKREVGKKKDMGKESDGVARESLENHVLLEYTLSTKLQRSSTRDKKAPMSSEGSKPDDGQVSVPSLLHLYRSVSAPTFGEKRPEFRPERLAHDQVSITYIIQDLTWCSKECVGEKEGPRAHDGEQTVTLEVVLTCTMETQSGQDEETSECVATDEQKQRLRHEALCLTRLQPLIEEYRHEESRRRRTTSSPSQSPEVHVKKKTSDPNLLRGRMFARGRTCGVCQRKFKPFAWKRHCETCEKLVCNQCLSVATASPSLSRRKIRVCSQCLSGNKDSGGALARVKAEVLQDDETSLVSCDEFASPLVLSESSTVNVSLCPSLESDTAMLSQVATPGTPSRFLGRIRIDLDLDPSLVAASMNTVDRRRGRSPQSQSSQEVVVCPASDASDSLVVARRNNRRVILFSHPDPDEDKSASAKSRCFRRTKIVLLDDAQTNLAACRPLDSITPVLSSAALQSLYSTTGESEDYERTRQKYVGSSTDSLTMVQFVQLKTPEPDYELDFSWYNIFPKAPVQQTADELARVKYLEATGLKLDAFSHVFLRYDKELEALVHRVLKVASQWHACSVNIVGSYDVHCLVTAYNTSEQVLDGDRSEPVAYPMTVDGVVHREESVSAYAVHHRSPFFVGELKHDIRFQAHPLHTEQGAVSMLSFPIYSAGVGLGESQTQGDAYCIATLDLWKCGHVPASSHVSPDWMSTMKNLLDEISARLETLALESHAFAMPRARAYHSLGSLCDAKRSTRRSKSVIGLHDMDSEFAVDASRFPEAETTDQLTTLSYDKVRGSGLGGMTSSWSSTWRYDSDNESTTSSQSASSSCSQSSRFSSYYYSVADMHSTIESLLQQASKTSKYISETGVSI